MASVLTGAVNLSKPEKIAPASTFISEVEYNPKEETLDIVFKSGTKIRYLQFSPITYLSFKQSPTQDSFYSRAIKGNFQSVKIVDQGIGREKSAPLDKITRKGTLNAGLKRIESRNERIAGTVNRAIAAARD